MTQFIPSPEQQAIFDAVLNTKDNIAIAALAGTGKTTSLVELSRRLPPGGSRIFCAFNKDIVKELESRLNGTGVTARTFHSIGLGALKKHLNIQELPPQADKYKVLVAEWATDNGVLELALSDAVQSYEPEERAEKLYQLRKATLAMFVNLLSFVRLKLVAWDDINALDDLVVENALDADMEYDGHNDAIMELVLSNVEKLMKQAEEQTRKLIIDYTDMIYWAVKWNARFFQYQWVLVDECQDLSPLQREMIAKIVYPRGGRIVLVGDPNQAIYAFAGADSNSFSLSVERWNCKVLPLTMTRRCDAIITQHASQLVPAFRCPDDKSRGKVVWLPEETLHKHARIGDMVLSRVKAPLVKSCLSLIAEGIPASILGADIGKQLVAMLEKVTKRSGYTFSRLLDEIIAYRDEQIEAAMQKDDEARAEAIRDTFNALKFVIEAYPNAPDIKAIEDKILGLFADDKPSDSVVTLATVHKSKGLEAKRVFILAPDKLPLHVKNMTAEQFQQEINLDYVARTRAKNELVYMTNPKFLKYAVMPAYVQEDFEDKNWDAPLVAEPVIEAELGDESATIVDAVFKPDGMFIEAFSTPDDVPVTFTVQITEQLDALPANHGLFAVDGDTKMFIAPHIMHKGKFFVETVNGTYTQQILSLDDALAQMEAFSPVPSTWNEISAKDWGFATAQHKTLAERRAEKADAPQPEPESAGFTNSIVHQALELIGENKGMYATANNAKMFITPLENRYVVKTIFSNGDDNNPVDTIQEALDLMFDFQPDSNLWEVLSHDEWADKVNPTPLVEASEPLPFATTMHKRLNDLNWDYDPDTGLFADGATTTMYITTDIEDNFVVYERDYADEPELAWSSDYKTTDIVTLISKMKVINPNADEWELGAWGDWTTREHLVDEPAPDTDIEHITEEELPIFNLLAHPQTPVDQRNAIQATVKNLLNTLKAEYFQLDWYMLDTGKASVKQAIEDILDRDWADMGLDNDCFEPKTEAIYNHILNTYGVTQPQTTDTIRDMAIQMGGVVTDAPQPETPSADAPTIFHLVKIIQLTRMSNDDAEKLATRIHQHVSPLLTFTDWIKSNRARVKVAIKHVLREAKYADNDGIEIVSDEIADFYQNGEIPPSKLLANTKESGAVVDDILDSAPEPEPTDTPIEAQQPLVDMTTPPTPGTDSWFVAMITKRLLIPESPETLKLANAIYEASVTHLPNIDWVSFKGVAKLKTAIIRVMNDHNYPPPSSGIYRDTVVDDIVLFFDPGQLEASANEPTFSNGENPPSYTNGKDHSASTTPAPAPLPSSAPDVLKSLIDQFRPLELSEITLMLQALEHVRKEKTEGAGVA